MYIRELNRAAVPKAKTWIFTDIPPEWQLFKNNYTCNTLTEKTRGHCWIRQDLLNIKPVTNSCVSSFTLCSQRSLSQKSPYGWIRVSGANLYRAGRLITRNIKLSSVSRCANLFMHMFSSGMLQATSYRTEDVSLIGGTHYKCLIFLTPPKMLSMW